MKEDKIKSLLKLCDKLENDKNWQEVYKNESKCENGFAYTYNYYNASLDEYIIVGYTIDEGNFSNIYARRIKNKNIQEQSKPAKKVNNLKVFAGAGIVIGGILSGLALYDANFDHSESICPLTSVLGVNHQIDRINDIPELTAVSNGKYNISKSIIDGYKIEEQKEKKAIIGINSDGINEQIGEEIIYHQNLIPKYTFENVMVEAKPNEIVVINEASSEVTKRLVLK